MSTELVILTGMSGSGKSVALHALEDLGYFCVDNLPPELLQPFLNLKRGQECQRWAIAIDIRTTSTLTQLPAMLRGLEQAELQLHILFLDAGDQTLVRRFSETRRRHPLSQTGGTHERQALLQAITRERELLQALRQDSHVIDTSQLRPAQLMDYVKAQVGTPAQALTLVLESFAFKQGIALDADYVFDVRMLPNPHYEAALRELTGRDQPVINFLDQQEAVQDMYCQVRDFLAHWLPALARDHRSYVTVAIGCTGGQHRSVYLVEKLVQHFESQWPTLTRHRELDARRPA